MKTIIEEFNKNDYILIKEPFSSSTIDLLESEYAVLIKSAQDILNYTINKNICLNEFYKNNPDQLIVVPEAARQNEICRFEYITGFSKKINEYLVARIKVIVENLMGQPFLLFKDKCNIKKPGGGAFPPHQDIVAYRHFKPKFYITVAVMLDDATIENGCLEVARGYKQNVFKNSSINSDFGIFPFFDFYPEGDRNGDIKDEICCNFKWESIKAKRGDIFIFNAFVPHCSKKNMSKNSRRILFFTFNSKSDGDFYEYYYNSKRRDFGNPMFHVSTPTYHDKKINNSFNEAI